MSAIKRMRLLRRPKFISFEEDDEIELAREIQRHSRAPREGEGGRALR